VLDAGTGYSPNPLSDDDDDYYLFELNAVVN
jgi:hypothetical protein